MLRRRGLAHNITMPAPAIRAEMAATSVLLLLTCLRAAQSDDVINIVELAPGQLVSANVSLHASDTYSIASTVPLRIKTTVNATSRYVVFIVRELENILKWTLPSNPDSFSVNASVLAAEHTFVPCFLSNSTVIYIDVFTDSTAPVGYALLIDKLDLFNLSISESYDTNLKLAQPQLYYFKFPPGISAVTVHAASNDTTTCAFVSVQSTSICSPTDTLYDAITVGIDQSMTSSAVLTITRENMEQLSYYLVLIPASSTFCKGILMSHESGEKYTKRITFSVENAPILSAFIIEIILPPLVLLMFAFMMCIIVCYSYAAKNKKENKSANLDKNQQDEAKWIRTLKHICCNEFPDISRKTCYCCTCDCCEKKPSAAKNQETDSVSLIIKMDEENSSGDGNMANQQHGENVPKVQMNEKNKDSPPINNQCDEYQALLEMDLGELKLHQLSKEHFQKVKANHAAYIWTTVTVGIYYAIPALQVALAKAINQQTALPVYEENQQCYYNYQCAIALGYFPAFNNVISNSGYVVLGLAFIIIVAIRQCYFKRKQEEKDTGLTPGNGLYYAIGLALIGEGFMSGLYHVCPSDINFQFDTTFMFIIAGLIIAKIVQNRHPYFNANSFVAFWGFSVVTLATVIGLYVDRQNSVAIRVVLLIILLVITIIFYSSLNIFNQLTLLCKTKYICGRGKCNKKLGRTIGAIGLNGVTMLLLFFLPLHLNVATIMLILFAGNAGILCALYLYCKCHHSEPKIAFQLTILLSAIPLWICAAIFFFKHVYDSGMTPAISRELNKPCYIGGFYDNHDFWHFMSAAAMFTTFMGILALDDGLRKKRKEEIHVF